MNVHEAITLVADAARAEVIEALRVLLEERHLYQHVIVPTNTSRITEAKAQAKPVLSGNYENDYLNVFLSPWRLTVPASGPPPGPMPHPIAIPLSNVKLYCRACRGLETSAPFNAVEILRHPVSDGLRNDLRQVWAVSYACQYCAGVPDAFLISRAGTRLDLGGRYPIEFVSTPPYIPKREQPHYSSALLAFRSGQVLPGLFMLRVFIEQFAHRLVPDKLLQGDDLFAAYNALLPEALRGSFPSLREAYSDLSQAIHAANATDTLFESIRERIDRHFDARRVFGLPDPI